MIKKFKERNSLRKKKRNNIFRSCCILLVTKLSMKGPIPIKQIFYIWKLKFKAQDPKRRILTYHNIQGVKFNRKVKGVPMWLSEMSKNVGLQAMGWKSGGNLAIVGSSSSLFTSLNSSKLSVNIWKLKLN